MSHLASVQRITSLSPIEGADRIEVCEVLGWKVVVKKGDFQVGDLVAYIAIDTIVPAEPQFEFLRERNFRVRTIKLRKQLSQGLVIPLPSHAVSQNFWKEGDDLTTVLGVKKFEKTVEIPDAPPAVPKIWYKRLWYRFKYQFLYKLIPSLRPVSKKPFPTNEVRKTDEERIQNVRWLLERYAGAPFVVSEKLDGSSITLLHTKNGNARVCSRNWEYVKPNNEYTEVFKSTGMGRYLKLLADFYGTNKIIAQGEYIGKPQKNPYKLERNQIRLFNIFVDGKQLSPDEFYDVCGRFSIPVCPYLGRYPLNHTLDSILVYAEGKSLLVGIEREGVVFRKADDASVSFKVVSNKFLLKNEE